MLALLAAGCAAPATRTDALVPAPGSAEASTTVVFHMEIKFLVAAVLPGNAAPCGGATVGAADNTAQEWDMPHSADRAHLALASDAAVKLPLSMCLVRPDGSGVEASGTAPFTLDSPVDAGAKMFVVVRPGTSAPSPQPPQRITVTATSYAD